MGSIAGTYTLESNDNYDAWLAVVGDQLTIDTRAGDKSFSNTITNGKDSKATLPGGVDYTVCLTASGSEVKGTFNFLGKPGNAECVFTDAGFTQTMTAAGVTTKRTYKRQ